MSSYDGFTGKWVCKLHNAAGYSDMGCPHCHKEMPTFEAAIALLETRKEVCLRALDGSSIEVMDWVDSLLVAQGVVSGETARKQAIVAERMRIVGMLHDLIMRSKQIDHINLLESIQRDILNEKI